MGVLLSFVTGIKNLMSHIPNAIGQLADGIHLNQGRIHLDFVIYLHTHSTPQINPWTAV